MTEALAYLRVSGKGQISGDGFPRQRDAIRQYAKAHGIEVVDEYRDEGVSGTKDLDDRDGLSDLIARVRSNGSDSSSSSAQTDSRVTSWCRRFCWQSFVSSASKSLQQTAVPI